MSGAETRSGGGRIAAVQRWLARKSDIPLGRLALQWFRHIAALDDQHPERSGVALGLLAYASILITVALACAVFSPVWAEWRQAEKQLSRAREAAPRSSLPTDNRDGLSEPT